MVGDDGFGFSSQTKAECNFTSTPSCLMMERLMVTTEWRTRTLSKRHIHRWRVCRCYDCRGKCTAKQIGKFEGAYYCR